MSEVEFEKELLRVLPMGKRTAAKMVPPEAVDDVLQDACLSAWRFRHTFRQDAAFGTWFTRIVFNAAYMFLRKYRIQKTRYVTDQVAGSESGEDVSLYELLPDDGCWNPEEMLLRAEQRGKLRYLIDGLANPLLKKQIELYIEGKSGNNSKEKARVNRAKAMMIERAQGVA